MDEQKEPEKDGKETDEEAKEKAEEEKAHENKRAADEINNTEETEPAAKKATPDKDAFAIPITT